MFSLLARYLSQAFEITGSPFLSVAALCLLLAPLRLALRYWSVIPDLKWALTSPIRDQVKVQFANDKNAQTTATMEVFRRWEINPLASRLYAVAEATMHFSALGLVYLTFSDPAKHLLPEHAALFVTLCSGSTVAVCSQGIETAGRPVSLTGLTAHLDIGLLDSISTGANPWFYGLMMAPALLKLFSIYRNYPVWKSKMSPLGRLSGLALAGSIILSLLVAYLHFWASNALGAFFVCNALILHGLPSKRTGWWTRSVLRFKTDNHSAWRSRPTSRQHTPLLYAAFGKWSPQNGDAIQPRRPNDHEE